MKHYEDAILILVTDYEDGTTEVQERKLHNKNASEVEAIASRLWQQRHFSEKKRTSPTRFWICDGVPRVFGKDGKATAKVLKADQGVIKANAQAITAWAEGEGPLGVISHWQNFIAEGINEMRHAKSLVTSGQDHAPIYIAV